MAANQALRQAELAPARAHLFLEQLAQRLDQLHLHARRQAAHVVVRLDGDAGAAGEGDRLDDVGIERALRQEIRTTDLRRLLLEDVDEGAADDLALALGIVDALQLAEEELAGVAVHQRDVVVMAEQLDHLPGLVLAQQAVVDEDARSEEHTSELQSLMRISY